MIVYNLQFFAKEGPGGEKTEGWQRKYKEIKQRRKHLLRGFILLVIGIVFGLAGLGNYKCNKDISNTYFLNGRERRD